MSFGAHILFGLSTFLWVGAGAALGNAVGASSDGGFEMAVRHAVPRVVKLYGLGAGLEQGYGSGVLVGGDGLVITVLSLLIDARNIRAVTADGALHRAVVVYRDEMRQTALLKLSSPENDDRKESVAADGTVGAADGSAPSFPHFHLDVREPAGGLAIGAGRLSPGDWVVAAGNAFKVADGAETVSIAHGVFSTRTRLDARRRLRDFPYTGDVLVIDGIVSNPGAPGGAIVNLDGQLVGMIGREVISNLTHTHLNYGLPVDVLRETVDEYRRKSSETAADGGPRAPIGEKEPDSAGAAAPRTVDLGLRLSKTGYQAVLPYVERVLRDSPAAKLGIRKDDLILSVGSRNVASVDEYEARLQAVRPGEDVVLVVRRGREILSFRFHTDGAEAKP